MFFYWDDAPCFHKVRRQEGDKGQWVSFCGKQPYTSGDRWDLRVSFTDSPPVYLRACKRCQYIEANPNPDYDRIRSATEKRIQTWRQKNKTKGTCA